MNLEKLITNPLPRWNVETEQQLHRFPIFIQRHEWTLGTSLHRQPGVEIHFTHDGNGALVINNQVVLQSPRTVTIFWANQPHQFIANDSYRRTVVGFLPDELLAISSLLDFTWIPPRILYYLYIWPSPIRTARK